MASLVKTSPAARVMLVVDQFEEAFTLCHVILLTASGVNARQTATKPSFAL